MCKETAYHPRCEALPFEFVQRASEADQVKSLKYHAEKKVLASLLQRTAAEMAMRVNFKVCADCHSFLTHASRLLGRPIHVLEPSRQHVFHEGRCSCGAERTYVREGCGEEHGGESIADDGDSSCTTRAPEASSSDRKVWHGLRRLEVASAEMAEALKGLKRARDLDADLVSDGHRQAARSQQSTCGMPAAPTGLGDVACSEPTVREQVRRAIEQFALVEGELGAIMHTHGLTCEATASARMVDAAVMQISLSLERRGEHSYKLHGGDSEAEARRIGSVRRYFEKLVRREMCSSSPSLVVRATVT